MNVPFAKCALNLGFEITIYELDIPKDTSEHQCLLRDKVSIEKVHTLHEKCNRKIENWTRKIKRHPQVNHILTSIKDTEQRIHDDIAHVLSSN